MSEQRTMLVPGQGIVRQAPPTKEFEEYPKMMTHPAFVPGSADKEIKVLDENGNPTGRVMYRGGQSVRFPHVLVRDRAGEEYHASQGYGNAVKCDEAAFNRAVATAVPVASDYKPIEFPKWSHGKLVNNPEEEAEHLRELGIDAMGRPLEVSSEVAGEPAIDTDVNTLEVFPAAEDDEIAALEAKLAALKAKKAEPIVTLVPPAEPVTQVTAPTELDPAIAAMRAERARKMREGKARKKAEREQAAKAG